MKSEYNKICLVVVCTITFLTACGQKGKIYDNGVVINGVKWATCNVDKVGTFADTPESAGMFYQWNRKTAWAANGDVFGWHSENAIGDQWEKINDPSPVGWRVPTHEDFLSLLDSTKVSSIFTTQNGIEGREFRDIETGVTMFLPAVSYRYADDGTLALVYVGAYGNYWSSTQYDSNYSYFLRFASESIDCGYRNRSLGYTIRSVAE
ncbi:MAG: fibrobacter succinogenes major paralogous domain-containing protein [Prevotellaceae bacterium]|jgi:uncharacterized protein (TIGR02145 family)|nr:fibrobacter succinogenes major paralogous domain-containing protein [Prevotellaceae bacterium]